MQRALRIMPSIRSARASRVSISNWWRNKSDVQFFWLMFRGRIDHHLFSDSSPLHSHLSVHWSSPHPNLKVPLPWKTPLSPASPDSTTAPMARSPSPLPSASCPRTPPSPPPLELHPTCSTVTQVARTAVHSGKHPPCHGACLPFLRWTHLSPAFTSGVNLPSTLVRYWCLCVCMFECLTKSELSILAQMAFWSVNLYNLLCAQWFMRYLHNLTLNLKGKKKIVLVVQMAYHHVCLICVLTTERIPLLCL